MREEPEHERDGLVTRQVVEDEEHPERRQLRGEGDPDTQPLLPALPPRVVLQRAQPLGWLGQPGKDGFQLLLEPRVEDRIGRLADALDPNLSRLRMKQRQLLGCALPNVLVEVVDRSAIVPVVARIRERLVRARLVLRPDREDVLAVGRFDQPLFARASGSSTVTVPLLRLRRAFPVSHQLRSLLQTKPASCKTNQTV